MNDNLGILLRSQGILNRWRNQMQLEENKKDNAERDTADNRSAEEKAEDEREYIEHRLRELRAWERRISGK